jgi:hypothetical protein
VMTTSYSERRIQANGVMPQFKFPLFDPKRTIARSMLWAPHDLFAAEPAGRGGVCARCTLRNASHMSEAREMPWTPDDAERHTHEATTRALKELWAKVANECLAGTNR